MGHSLYRLTWMGIDTNPYPTFSLEQSSSLAMLQAHYRSLPNRLTDRVPVKERRHYHHYSVLHLAWRRSGRNQ